MRYYEIADRPRAQTATDRVTRDEPRHLRQNAGRFWPSGGSLRMSGNAAKAKKHILLTRTTYRRDAVPRGPV
jgi:hypothetical protein